MFDELEQVIDSAARSINRFLQPGVSVNSSTVPYNISNPGQNKKEFAYAQNQKNSADDDGWKTSTTMVCGKRRIGTEIVNWNILIYFRQCIEGWGTRWCWSHLHAASSTKVTRYAVRCTTNDEKRRNITVKYVNHYEKGSTMTWRIERWRRLLEVSHISVNTLRQCGDNDVSNVTVSALLHATSAL